ncbi:PH domain-containing protein [Halovivax cerinus]|uniref:PH domain-containing protein n=1 Tax=Halovivax cerinus TaxID=1487865 RepID=A0ABD5NQA7_9EURY|nr:PH domain-containing protein [Halovivax cerinus]
MRASGETADWVHLSDGERITWASRPHPIALGTRFVGGFLTALAGLLVASWAWTADYGLVGWLGIGVAVVGVAAAVLSYAFFTNTRYVITTEQLYAKRGVVSRDVTQLSLDRVQNTTLRQSVAGRLLGYGDIDVYTAGSGEPEVTFERAPDPGEAREALATQIGRSGNGTRT